MPASAAVALLRRRPEAFAEHAIDGVFDEMFCGPDRPREHCARVHEELLRLPAVELRRRQQAARLHFLHEGIPFGTRETIPARSGDLDAVPGEREEAFACDLIPRVLSAAEWRRIEHGVTQRLQALDLFLADVYAEARILRDGVVAPWIVCSSRQFRLEMRGVRVPHGRHLSAASCDLVRLPDGEFSVLADDLRVPRGASRMLATRQILKRVLPALFHDYGVRSVDHYPQTLLAGLLECAPIGCTEPRVVLLGPGVHDPSGFEHTYLARRMGVELVEGNDLTVHQNVVYARTISGLERVDVIHRCIDDDLVDPLAFCKDSQLGAAGLFNAYRSGNVAIVNAIGTGLAGDEAVYTQVPEIIRYYLGEDPILPNVRTLLLERSEDRREVLEHLERFVVRRIGDARTADAFVGPEATSLERAEMRVRIQEHPRGFIARPLLAPSCAPCFVGRSIESRPVDLRVFVLQGERTCVVPGGLTRIARHGDAFGVDSARDDGGKDTWVLEARQGASPGAASSRTEARSAHARASRR